MRFISADYLYTLDLKPIKNGANALGFYKYGTIEVGKTPGINLITGSELGLANSKVKRIA